MPGNNCDDLSCYLLDDPEQITARINSFSEYVAAEMANFIFGPRRVHALVELLNNCPYSNKFTDDEIRVALDGLDTIRMIAAAHSDRWISRIFCAVKEKFDSSTDFDQFLSAVISLGGITDDPNTINIADIKVVLCGLRIIFTDSDEAEISNILFSDPEEME